MGSGFGMGGTWWFGLLLIIGIALLVVLAIRTLGGGIDWGNRAGANSAPRDGATQPGRSHARQVLDERYARGELDTEQYHELVRNLGEDT